MGFSLFNIFFQSTWALRKGLQTPLITAWKEEQGRIAGEKKPGGAKGFNNPTVPRVI